MPSLETLKHLQTISESVSQLMGSYKNHARNAIQGRRKSGRFNTVDIVHTAPQISLANEGYHTPAGKKRVA